MFQTIIINSSKLKNQSYPKLLWNPTKTVFSL